MVILANGTTKMTLIADGMTLMHSPQVTYAALARTLINGRKPASMERLLTWEVMDVIGTTPTGTHAVIGTLMISPQPLTAAPAMEEMAAVKRLRQPLISVVTTALGTGLTLTPAVTGMMKISLLLPAVLVLDLTYIGLTLSPDLIEIILINQSKHSRCIQFHL